MTAIKWFIISILLWWTHNSFLFTTPFRLALEHHTIVQTKKLNSIKGNWFFVKNLNFLMLKSLQHDGVNLLYFKIRSVEPTEFIVWNIYGHTMGSKDIGIRKSVYVAKTQFSCRIFVETFIYKQWIACTTDFFILREMSIAYSFGISPLTWALVLYRINLVKKYRIYHATPWQGLGRATFIHKPSQQPFSHQISNIIHF